MNYQPFTQNELAHTTPEMAQAKQFLFDELVSSATWLCSKNQYKVYRPYNFVYWLSPNSRAFFRRIAYINKGDGFNGEVFVMYSWKYNGKIWYICVLHKYDTIDDEFSKMFEMSMENVNKTFKEQMLNCIYNTFNQLVFYNNLDDAQKWIFDNRKNAEYQEKWFEFDDIKFKTCVLPTRAPPLHQGLYEQSILGLHTIRIRKSTLIKLRSDFSSNSIS